MASTMHANSLANTGNKRLWAPPPAAVHRIDHFRLAINQKYSLSLGNYHQLWQWSIDNIADFWTEVWLQTDVIYSQKWHSVYDPATPMKDIPAWFPGAKLNWAENMLRHRPADKICAIEFNEPIPGSSGPTYNKIDYSTLFSSVARAASSLKQLGIKPNDTVAFYGSNSIPCLISMLAVTSLGAIWSSCGADFGTQGVLDRFKQIKPKVLIGINAVRYNGKVYDHLAKMKEVAAGLEGDVKVIVAQTIPESEMVLPEEWCSWHSFLKNGQDGPIDFYQADFDHPLWILFSSGTTGVPKAIVHRAGGMLLQSQKEHILHGGMTENDCFFYHATPGWMMLNYLYSGLSLGLTLVLFDGSPLHDPSLLWKMADDLDLTVFGTSAKYIDVLAKSYQPKQHHQLKSLTQILSTGSPLRPELFDWVYENVKSDLLLGSITGGTDICSLFAGHNVSLPVYRGEIQCLNLGMAVSSYSEDGEPVKTGETGDLVCTKPFPCMPVYLWNDEHHKRYHSSYFSYWDGKVWHHGDHCMITESRDGNGGGLIMLGRSDSTLNPGGIRFGSSEIIDCVSSLRDSDIVDCLAVGQATQDGADERVCLFVKLLPGKSLDDALIKRLKTEIRAQRSPRHVPEIIMQVNDIPHTINGKKVEVIIKKILNGSTDLSKLNRATLANPECLEEYLSIAKQL